MSFNIMISPLIGLICLLLSSYGESKDLSLFVNQDTFKTGDVFELTVSFDQTEILINQVDVYLTVQFPDGSLYYLRYPEGFYEKNQIGPFITAWSISHLSKQPLLNFEIAKGLASGVYKWYLTLCQVDQDVAQPINWIAEASVQVELEGNQENILLEEVGSSETMLSPTAGPPTFDMADSAEVASARPTTPTEPSLSRPSSGKVDSDGEGAVGDDSDDRVIIIEPIPDISPQPPQSGLLTAGDIDDNLNYVDFQNYFDKKRQTDDAQILPTIDISDRVALHILDSQGQGLSNAQVQIRLPQTTTPLLESFAGTDGTFYFFPHFDDLNYPQLEVQITPPVNALSSPTTTFNNTMILSEELGSPNTVTFNTILELEQLGEDRDLTFSVPEIQSSQPQALDIMLVIDTTGSMSDELHYLTTELRDIISAVHRRHPQVAIRFGLVVYRDEGDEYVVRTFDFTESLNLMQVQLSEQRAMGGGDYPEAMEQALATAIQAQWQEGHIARVMFLVADAPPHDENLEIILESIRQARQKGLRIYSLAASGVADTAEWIMRSAALLTQARYLFLTDDSGIGYSHAEPTVPCYVVTRLDQLITQVIASELAGQRLEPEATEIIRTVGNYDKGVCLP